MTDQYDPKVNRKYESRNNASSTLAGLVIGALAGAGAMLLLAPKSGKETREDIRQRALELREQTVGTVQEKVTSARAKAEQVTAEARDKAAELKQRGKEIAVEQLDRVSTAAENGKKALTNS
jgi:gas vesicle protein